MEPIEIRLMERLKTEGHQQFANHVAKFVHEHYLGDRWGAFEAIGTMSVVYCNVGTKHAMARDRFRRELEKRGVSELAMGTWPKEGESAGHTWAMVIDAPDPKEWEELAVDCWLAENDTE